ncbi:MAG: nitroreductase [Clostridiales bacterium]|nr:nitroreductase [Clostridiales bacterium]
MPLDTMEAIRTRYSCRAFTDKMPPDGDLKLIAEAAAASPSGSNRQPWRVIIVKNKELVSDMEAAAMANVSAMPDKAMYDRIMSRGGKAYYNAPCYVIIHFEKPASPGGASGDCGILIENVALAATSLGINSLICGMISLAFAGEKGVEFRSRLGIPEDHDIGVAVLLGYAAEPGGKPHEPDLEKVTFFE